MVSTTKSVAPLAAVGLSTLSGMAPGTSLVPESPSVAADLAGSSAVRSVGGMAVSCGQARVDLGAVLAPGKSLVAVGLAEDVSDREPAAPALKVPAEALAAQVKGGAKRGNKGKNKKAAGQRPVVDVQQQTVDNAPGLVQLEGDGHLLSSADRDKEGVEGSKLGPGTGDGGSLNSALSGSVVQCLGAVVAKGVPKNWAEECDAGEGVNSALDQLATSSSVSKTKQKGKALLSSK